MSSWQCSDTLNSSQVSNCKCFAWITNSSKTWLKVEVSQDNKYIKPFLKISVFVCKTIKIIFQFFFYWLFQVAAFSATLIFSVTLVLKYGAKTKVDNIGQLWLCHGITYMYFTVRKYSCKYVIMIITSVQQHISFKCEYIFAVVFQ